MQPEVERRHVPVEIRAETGDDGTTIEGYASVFESMSEDLGGFKEVIKPGAFDRALKEKHDVRALVNHNPDLILGRTKSGTLDLSVDKKGLLSKITPPDTQAAKDTVESIKRGDIDGMSFAFRVLSDEWRTEEGEPLREVNDLELLDVSVVAYPAYAQTEVSARARTQAKDTLLEQLAKDTPGVPMEVLRRRLEQRIREAS